MDTRTSLNTCVGLLALGLFVFGPLGLAAAAEPGDTQNLLVATVQEARTPSRAVEAFASALSVDPKDTRLYQAYVQKMADFGLPDMAYSQAQMLVNLDPKSGIAWGVIAAMKAREGAMPEAFDAINKALETQPDNPFVLNLAGQLVAWCDQKTADPAVLAKVAPAARTLRAQCGGQNAFKEGYATAQAAFQGAEAKEIPAANEAKEQPKAAEKPRENPPAPGYVPYTYGYRAYGSTYGPGYFPPYCPYYPTYYPFVIVIRSGSHRHSPHHRFLIFGQFGSVGIYGGFTDREGMRHSLFGSRPVDRDGDRTAGSPHRAHDATVGGVSGPFAGLRPGDASPWQPPDRSRGSDTVFGIPTNRVGAPLFRDYTPWPIRPAASGSPSVTFGPPANRVGALLFRDTAPRFQTAGPNFAPGQVHPPIRR